MRSVHATALAAVLGGALLLTNVRSQGQAVEPPARPTWEYKSVNMKGLVDLKGRRVNPFKFDPELERQLNDELDSALNELGADGWELVTDINGGLIFKRPK